MDLSDLHRQLREHRETLAAIAEQTEAVDRKRATLRAEIEKMPQGQERATLELQQAALEGQQIQAKTINALLERQATLEAAVITMVQRLEAVERHVGAGPGSN